MCRHSRVSASQNYQAIHSLKNTRNHVQFLYTDNTLSSRLLHQSGHKQSTMGHSHVLVLACCLLVAGSQAESLKTAALARFLAHSPNGTIGTVKTGVQTGQVKQIGGLDAYVAGDNGSPKAAVILFSDVFGWALNNTRLWADSLARDTGYLVVLPDFFRGQALAQDAPLSPDVVGPWYVPSN